MKFDSESLDTALRQAAPGAAPAPGLWDEIEGRAVARRRSVRRRRGALAAGATALVVLVSGTAALVSTRHQPVEVLVSGDQNTSGVSPNGALGGRTWWDGVRTSPDGRRLVFVFTGAAPFVEGDPCSVDYTGLAKEAADRVIVARVARAGGELAEDQGCVAVGHARTVEVDLPTPLDGRRIVDPASGASSTAFPGARLWELPDPPVGWQIVSDGGSSDGDRPIWYRRYGPGDGTSVGVDIMQGPPSWLAARSSQPGRAEERPVTVHGLPGMAYLDGGGWNVAWVEDDEATLVSARSLDGASMETPDALLTLADSLRRLGPP